MKALIHMSGEQKRQLQKRADEIVMKERQDIALRAQYIWAMAMLQAGLSPRTVEKVRNYLPIVAEKYKDYQTAQLGDLFMQRTLESAGVKMPLTGKEKE